MTEAEEVPVTLAPKSQRFVTRARKRTALSNTIVRCERVWTTCLFLNRSSAWSLVVGHCRKSAEQQHTRHAFAASDANVGGMSSGQACVDCIIC